VTTTSVGSGDKLLRNIILDNKLELYGLYVWCSPLMSCGFGLELDMWAETVDEQF
jgi:hypothetical protein